jgi:hypothetical protein
LGRAAKNGRWNDRELRVTEREGVRKRERAGVNYEVMVDEPCYWVRKFAGDTNKHETVRDGWRRWSGLRK